MRATFLRWCLLPLWLMSCSKAPIPPARMDLTVRTPPATIPWAPPSALKEAWRVDLGEGGWSPEQFVGDHIVIRSRDSAYLLDARTGARGPTLTAPDGRMPAVPPGVEPAHILLFEEEFAREDGFSTGKFSAFDTDTGNLLWNVVPDRAQRWCQSGATRHRGLPWGVAADVSRCLSPGCTPRDSEHPTTLIISQCPPLYAELADKLPILLQRLLPETGRHLKFTAISLDPLTGKTRWERDLGTGVFRPACCICGDLPREWFDLADDRFLYMLGPEDAHELSVYDLEDGRLLWRRKFQTKRTDIDIYPAGDLVWVAETSGRPTPYFSATGEPVPLTKLEADVRYQEAFPLSKIDSVKARHIPHGPVDIGDHAPAFEVMTRDAVFTVVDRRRVEVLDPVKLDLLVVLDHKEEDFKPSHNFDGKPEYPQVEVYPGALASGEPIVLTMYGRTLYGWRRSLP